MPSVIESDFGLPALHQQLLASTGNFTESKVVFFAQDKE